MGRRQTRDCTDEYLNLGVRWCKRRGYLRPGWSGILEWLRRGERFASVTMSAGFDLVTLQYKGRRYGEWQDMHYHIAVEWTPCHLGGERAWFRCPARDRRAAILYIGGNTACRQCRQLVYPSQREQPHGRALLKAQGIHEKLGGTGILGDRICKPKGMHWRTFSRHVERMREADCRSWPTWISRHFMT
jgi:hypothetical protein